MAKTERKKPDATMEQAILAAAEALFLDKGFALSSTTEIARRAGCNQALVHYYFRTKEQLFLRIFQDKLRMFVTRFLAIYQQGIPFEEKIMQLVDAHFDILQEDPRLPALIVNEVAADPKRVAELRESAGHLPLALFSQLDEDLRHEIRAGRARPMQTADLLIDILSLDAFPFLVSPLLRTVLDASDSDLRAMLARRREAVKKTLLNSLRP